MGWLLKQTQFTNSTAPLFTLGQQRQILVVGLGNIGKEYDGTRHNIGFYCVDAFLAAHSELGKWLKKKGLKCYLAEGRLGDSRIIVIKPTTFMNDSGQAVSAVSHFYKMTPDNIIVIHDELDIPFGQIRMRVGGSSAGHNGIKSVTQSIDEMYGRVRIGIGPKKPAAIDSADFVLQSFDKSQQAQLPQLAKEVNVIVEEFVYNGRLPNETRSFVI
jgi:peptidyl-tRNA hydrolase, PTH1 family